MSILPTKKMDGIAVFQSMECECVKRVAFCKLCKLERERAIKRLCFLKCISAIGSPNWALAKGANSKGNSRQIKPLSKGNYPTVKQLSQCNVAVVCVPESFSSND